MPVYVGVRLCLGVSQRRVRQQSDTMSDRLLKQFNPDTQPQTHTLTEPATDAVLAATGEE